MDDEGIFLETVANGRANPGALGYTNQRTRNLQRARLRPRTPSRRRRDRLRRPGAIRPCVPRDGCQCRPAGVPAAVRLSVTTIRSDIRPDTEISSNVAQIQRVIRPRSRRLDGRARRSIDTSMPRFLGVLVIVDWMIGRAGHCVKAASLGWEHCSATSWRPPTAMVDLDSRSSSEEVILWRFLSRRSSRYSACEDNGAVQWIETVPKHGYRFHGRGGSHSRTGSSAADASLRSAA